MFNSMKGGKLSTKSNENFRLPAKKRLKRPSVLIKYQQSDVYVEMIPHNSHLLGLNQLHPAFYWFRSIAQINDVEVRVGRQFVQI